jgi:Ca-activated chloride channel family protein
MRTHNGRRLSYHLMARRERASRQSDEDVYLTLPLALLYVVGMQTPRDQPADLSLSLAELAAAAGVSPRTVRYYIAQGLLAGPGARGRQASYGEDQLLRLRLIRRLVERHTPLAQIRDLVPPLGHGELVALLGDEDHRRDRTPSGGQSGAEEVAERLRDAPLARRLTGRKAYAAAPNPERYEGVREALWRRWDLAPGVELHVREDARIADRDRHELIARLLREIGAHERPRQEERDET